MGVVSKFIKKAEADYWAGRTLKCCLLTVAHDYASAASQEHYADISANESVGTGYTAGGVLVTTGLTSGYSGTNACVDTNNAVFSGITVPDATYCAIYDSVTGDIMAQYDLGGTLVTTGGTLTLVWSASGILTIS
jgi:hypothetical protein